LRAPVTANIRQEVWTKLLGNVSFNPISALTRGLVTDMLEDPHVFGLIRSIMTESLAVANHLGIQLPMTVDDRLAKTARVGGHKTSMLQDLEAGKPLEIEALVGAVLELGRLCGVAMPATSAVYACVKLLDRKTRSG
jgi:2-dehydropantoate 2-reductase